MHVTGHTHQLNEFSIFACSDLICPPLFPTLRARERLSRQLADSGPWWRPAELRLICRLIWAGWLHGWKMKYINHESKRLLVSVVRGEIKERPRQT